MASTFYSAKSLKKNLNYSRDDGASVAVGTYELTAALVVDDVIEMVRVPAGCTVTDVTLITDDLDTGTALTLDVGYGGNDDYFIAASTVGQAGGLVRASAATAFPLAFTSEDTIDVHVDTAPGSIGAGPIAVNLVCPDGHLSRSRSSRPGELAVNRF